MDRSVKIGELLIDSGLIDGFQLNLALAYSRNWGCRIGEALISLGFLTEQNLRTFLVRQFSLPQVNLVTSRITKDVLRYIPENRAREYCVIPVDRITKRGITHLVVAMPDPTNLNVIDRLQFITDCWIVPTMASADLIIHAIDINYGVSYSSYYKKDDHPGTDEFSWSHNQSKAFTDDSSDSNARINRIEKYLIQILRTLIQKDPSSVEKLEDLLFKYIEDVYS